LDSGFASVRTNSVPTLNTSAAMAAEGRAAALLQSTRALSCWRAVAQTPSRLGPVLASGAHAAPAQQQPSCNSGGLTRCGFTARGSQMAAPSAPLLVAVTGHERAAGEVSGCIRIMLARRYQLNAASRAITLCSFARSRSQSAALPRGALLAGRLA